MLRPRSTKVRRRWLVETANTGIDLSDGASRIPLTWQTTVTDEHALFSVFTVGRYPTADSARRGHNRVVQHLKGGGVPTNYK